MKRYVIFAGVNGAGKTTLYHTNEMIQSMERVNLDEMVRSIGSWENASDVGKAGKLAVKKIRDLFDNRISFNQETTLCGHSILRNIEKAKRHGYIVELYYVGLTSVTIAKARVQKRVQAGGHDVPERDIERRYKESLQMDNAWMSPMRYQSGVDGYHIICR